MTGNPRIKRSESAQNASIYHGDPRGQTLENTVSQGGPVSSAPAARVRRAVPVGIEGARTARVPQDRARMTSGAARWDSCNVRGIHPQAPVRSLERERLRYGASTLRWVTRLLFLGMLVFGFMTIYFLTEQSAVDTSALSSSVGGLVEKGAWLVETGQSPSFVDDPAKWAGERVLLLSYKFSNHGLSVRQQAHVVEFALLGGVVALNVLAWASGWAHRRGQSGRIRVWRTWLMYALSMLVCAAASFADQYHKLYVPGRHFDKLDLFLDASGYTAAVTCVFIAWSIGSAIHRLILRK